MFLAPARYLIYGWRRHAVNRAELKFSLFKFNYIISQKH